MTITELKELDCGDNSCYFARGKGGMRTNGGCRCFENAGYPRSPTGAAFKLLPELLIARSERDSVLTQLKRTREVAELLARHMSKVTLSEMGGEPDMFGPNGESWEQWDDHAVNLLELLRTVGTTQG